MIEASKRLHPWRDSVIEAVRDQAILTDVIEGPIRVKIEFRIPRPKKPKHELPISRMAGDIDKLSRAILDALTIGGLIIDDSYVVSLTATKRYSPTMPGVTVYVEPVETDY
jgi:Holliday junction resolvase RusA-like endonuclease